MDDVGLVKTVLYLTCLSLLNSLGYVRGNSSRLGVRHKSSGTQNLTQTSYDAHHVGRSDDYVEVEPVLLHDLVNIVHAADIIGARLLGGLVLVLLAEYKSPYGLTGTVGENNRASYLLVGVT